MGFGRGPGVTLADHYRHTASGFFDELFAQVKAQEAALGGRPIRVCLWSHNITVEEGLQLKEFFKEYGHLVGGVVIHSEGDGAHLPQIVEIQTPGGSSILFVRCFVSPENKVGELGYLFRANEG